LRLDVLTAGDVDEAKRASHTHAHSLSAAAESVGWQAAVDALVARGES